jgi:hypothetical protein
MYMLKLFYSALLSFFTVTVLGQQSCKDIDLNKVAPKWVWKKGYVDAQWNIFTPLRNELQRIMPQPPTGLYATFSIAYGKTGPYFYENGPRYYEGYLMLKKYECIMHPGPVVQPEGETGCWVYFVVNSINESINALPGAIDGGLYFHEYPSRLYVNNLTVEKDANGNRVLYSNYRPDETKRMGIYFSAKDRLPMRRLTRKELFTTYKLYHEKRLAAEIARFEKLVRDDERTYASLSADEKRQQSYWPDIIRTNKASLQKYTTEKAGIPGWYNAALQQSNINDLAEVETITAYAFLPEKLSVTPGTGYQVWIDDRDFYDKTTPKDQPQFIFFYDRRQDENLPKLQFMDKLYNEFNMDVLCRMAGEAIKKPNAINTKAASLGVAKTATSTQQHLDEPVAISFDNTADGQFPTGWNGTRNSMVQTHDNGKWLAIRKDGYWYPQQYNKAIGNNFSLSFDLAWNPDIGYNGGLFTVTLSEMSYDNTAERYRLDDNQEMYLSLYDGYVGSFNRVILWFDPYWNDGGTLQVNVYDKRESLLFNKRIVLPDFYKDKNQHQLGISRKEQSLIVTDNGKTIADLPGVFQPAVTYNLYTFSRYKGQFGDNPNDVFFLKNIAVKYK